jgi:putative restriction endonuclease
VTAAVFLHAPDSIYRDTPAEHYHFPKLYLSRVMQCVGDWIIYMEPAKARGSRGYFAVAKVQQVIDDPSASGMYYALIEPGSYLDFAHPVPFNGPLGVVERDVLNEAGRNSGRTRSAVRLLSPADFNRIITLGLADNVPILPRVDTDLPVTQYAVSEDHATFDHAPLVDRPLQLTSRLLRDRVFRQTVLRAYDSRCAITGLKLINGGGRAEAEAAHIRPVSAQGPDIVSNGLALSGTAHWMFDRGLIGLTDDLEIMISRQANDREGIRAMINKSGYAVAPPAAVNRPHPSFLAWHRANSFKL